MPQKRVGAAIFSLPVRKPLLQSFRFASVPEAAMIVVVASLYLLAQVCSTEGAEENPSRAQVVRITATSDADVNFVRQLRHKFNLDAWREAHQANTTGDFFVPSHLTHVLRHFLKLHGIPFTVLIDDTVRFISEHERGEVKQPQRRAATKDRYRYNYLTYTEMNSFLASVEYKATKAKVHIGFIGKSFEGRDTPYVKITSRRDPRPKGIIFIDGGIHSREWISPAMALEIIHRLALNTEQDPQVEQLLDKFDFIVVPLVNPDGYAYTFMPGAYPQADGTMARLWRKSRTSNYSHDFSCYGVDLNRNFGYKWNDSPDFGGSSDPCSPSFSGPFSFSEPESQNLRQLLLSNKDAIKSYLSFHSYGQYMLYPWGYKEDVEIEDEQDLIHVARAFKDTMRLKKYDYHVGGSADSLYPAAGGSSDYVRGAISVKYSYTIELPPHEEKVPWGFIVPERKVQPIVTDTWMGIKAFLFRLHSYTTDRTEKLQNIAREMEKRLGNASARDNESASKNVKENVHIPDPDTVPIMNDQRISDLLNVLGFKESMGENMTEKNKTVGRKPTMYNNSIKENGMYDTGTNTLESSGSMRSGSAKPWSIGDTLRNQYNYFNFNFRK